MQFALTLAALRAARFASVSRVPKAPGWPETPEINPLNHPQQLVFLELCPEINPWCCPGSGPPGTCRSLPRWSGPEIRSAATIFGPWGSRGIPWYPTLVPSLKGNFSPWLVGVIYSTKKKNTYRKKWLNHSLNLIDLVDNTAGLVAYM